ncbi:MAG: DnaD domain protein [Clostridia bacterium]|nr:DnaD domain protein [Clostridia bacterium]
MQEFTLPLDFVDNYILKAKPEYTVVYLYAYRHKDATHSAQSIAEAIGMDKETVSKAIDYWTEAGYNIFNSVVEKAPEKPKYTVKELNELADSAPDFEFMRTTVEGILGKAMTLGNCQTLAWMYKDAKLDVSSIILIANYAKKINKPRIKYMENIVEKMVENGIKTYEESEKFIARLKRADNYHNKIKKMFGIERELTRNEKQYFNIWLEELKPKDDELMRAYEECVDRTGNYSARYINGVLKNWKNDSIKPKKVNTVPTPKATKFNNFAPSGNIDYKKLEMEALKKQLARLKEGEK